MMGILEKAQQLNTEKIIKENFEVLKSSYNVNNERLSKETNIPIEYLEKIDKQEPVPFNIYEKVSEFFGIYTSDLFSEESLKPITGIFFRHKEDRELSVEERKFILKLHELGTVFREVNPIKETEVLRKLRNIFQNIQNENDIEKKGKKFRELLKFHLLSLKKIEKSENWRTYRFLKDFENFIYKNLGVKIFHIYLSNNKIKFESIYFPDLEIIFIKDPRLIETIFFRLFHELFHVFRKDKIKGFDICFGDEVRHPEDKYANRFAAAVLVPIDDLRVKLQNINDCNDIKNLYKEFIGSKETFKNRLKHIGIENEKVHKCLDNIKTGRKTIVIEGKNKIPKEIKKSIEKLYKESLITHSRKQELLSF